MPLNKAGRKILKRLRQRYSGKGARLQVGRYEYLLCPFHGERTASFAVDTKIGFYHCFGCHKHGDIWSIARTHPEVLGKEKRQKTEPLPFLLSTGPVNDEDIPF